MRGLLVTMPEPLGKKSLKKKYSLLELIPININIVFPYILKLRKINVTYQYSRVTYSKESIIK